MDKDRESVHPIAGIDEVQIDRLPALQRTPGRVRNPAPGS